MTIDFAVDVPNERAAEDVARLALQRGYASEVEFDETSERWTCYCSKRMVPTYDAVIAAQRELDDVSRPVGGHTDGWGTSGNA